MYVHDALVDEMLIHFCSLMQIEISFVQIDFLLVVMLFQNDEHNVDGCNCLSVVALRCNKKKKENI